MPSSEYLPFLIFGAFIFSVFAWLEWQHRFRPMFIPKAEIARMADELTEKYGDEAEEMAFTEEDRAWRYSQNFEQGTWRRVRRELERRRTFN